MTQEEKLKAVIEKAVKNGWVENPTKHYCIHGAPEVYSILFSHDFAKAYWGENKYPAWEYYLQQAVISEDPITYYYNH